MSLLTSSHSFVWLVDSIACETGFPEFYQHNFPPFMTCHLLIKFGSLYYKQYEQDPTAQILNMNTLRKNHMLVVLLKIEFQIPVNILACTDQPV